MLHISLTIINNIYKTCHNASIFLYIDIHVTDIYVKMFLYFVSHVRFKTTKLLLLFHKLLT